MPSVVSEGLPTTLYAHTEAAIDFAALRGKHVAVIGAAASAFDAAGVALEAGAASVRLFARRPSIAAVPITRSRGYPGAYDNYHALPDAIRWEQARRFRRWGSTPTTDAIERTVAFAELPSASRGALAVGRGRGRQGRGAGGGGRVPLRFRHRGDRLLRRSRSAPRTGGLPPGDSVVARSLRAAA